MEPPIVELARSITFQSAHTLPMMPDGHKCRNMHGHSYRLRVWLKGPMGDDGIVVDNAAIDTFLSSVRAMLDHRLLNECGIEYLEENPTAERIAVWAYRLARRSPGVHQLVDRVEIHEGPDSLFVYRGEGEWQ